MFSADFFQSLGYAIPALVIVGASWCLIGFIMGNCPKHNIPSAVIQQVAALVSIAVSFVVFFCVRHWLQSSWRDFFIISAFYAAGGAINFFMLQLMSKAMQKGPNGVVWAIIQSALIFPFMGGVFIFKQHANFIQWIGVGLIVASLFAFGLTKDNSISETQNEKKGLSWKILAFCALGCAAIQQNLTTAPSYFSAISGVPSILRAIATSTGAVIGYLILNIFHHKTLEESKEFQMCIRRPIFWKYVIAMQGFSLITTYLFLYPGIDIMAKYNLGGAAYPLMVGSCIIAFTLLAVIQLKERIRPLQIFGLLLCAMGLIGICLK